MAVMRVFKNKDYTVMSNVHFREKEMTLKAKGLLSLMLSLPDSWDYSINGLVAICKENESAIKSTLKELKEFGYLTVDKKMPNETESGRIEYIYNIFEQPTDVQKLEKQAIEKQGVENLPVENPTQLNTNKSIIKELSNKELSNKDIYSLILNYLFEKSGKHYKASGKETQRHINARIAEGFSVTDFKTVIDKKCGEWLGTDFEQYLRPQTLFGTKFESYLNAPVTNRKTYGATGIEIKQPAEDDLAGVF